MDYNTKFKYFIREIENILNQYNKTLIMNDDMKLINNYIDDYNQQKSKSKIEHEEKLIKMINDTKLLLSHLLNNRTILTN